jgi:hypothetical protein
MQTADTLRLLLMYVVLPLWLAAGFADYLCHRASRIAETSGWKESLLHLLQFAELAVPVLAALFLEINAAVILIMIVALVVHELTAIWDVRYATATRTVTPTEQHVHGVLEMLPLTALLMVIAIYWDQFISLFGFAPAQFELRLKPVGLNPWYIACMLAITLLFEVLPYFEEFARGLRRQPPGGAPRKDARA